jgi:hypothetical protein
MSDTIETPTDLDFPQAKLAFSIIENLLKHTEAVNDLIALMAHALDEDVARALTNTGQWENYLASKRTLERTHRDIEAFTAILQSLSTSSE